MLSEFFINNCLKLCVMNDNTIEKYNLEKSVRTDIYSNINGIFHWYKIESGKLEDLNENSKLIDLTYLLSSLKAKKPDLKYSNIRENITNGKYKDCVQTLDHFHSINLDKEFIEDFQEQLINKRRYCELTSGRQEFKILLENIELEDFDVIDSAINQWEEKITKYFNRIMEIKRIGILNEASTLSCGTDNLANVLNKYKESMSPEDVLPSGYLKLDKSFSVGGFEKRRLYLFAGESGSGKSQLLVNLMKNSIKSTKTVKELVKIKEKKIFVYITAENLIDETLARFYCCFSETSHSDFCHKLINDPNYTTLIEYQLKSFFNENGIDLQMFYIKAGKSTVRDINSILYRTSKEGHIVAVYLDYLDLLRDDLELLPNGNQISKFQAQDNISMDLKVTAVTFNCPLITATQLNRSGYSTLEDANHAQMGKSIAKVENSDFVAYLQKTGLDQVDTHNFTYTPIKCTVLKNRNGMAGFHFKLMSKLNNRYTGEDAFDFGFYEIDENEIILPSTELKEHTTSEELFDDTPTISS